MFHFYIKADPDQANLVPEFIHKERKPKILHCQPTNMPTFVYGLHPKVIIPYIYILSEIN